jgi:CRP-like cAMP-binding protein
MPQRGFFGVLSGMMQLSVSNADGNEKVVEIIGPGETFGEAVMFLHRSYPVDAVALLPVELVTISAEVIDALLATEATFARSMLASMASRLHTMVTDIEMYTLRSATQRVVGFVLRELGNRVNSGSPERIALRSTKQVVASRLGLSPETFSRVIRDLSDRGLLRVEGRSFVVPDPAALSTFVG